MDLIAAWQAFKRFVESVFLSVKSIFAIAFGLLFTTVCVIG